MAEHRLGKLRDEVARQHGLQVNPPYWQHYVHMDTGQLHVAIDLQHAFSFILGNELIVTDRVTMEQVGRLPAPDDGPGATYKECSRCGTYHKVGDGIL
jgi:hypothetical protein